MQTLSECQRSKMVTNGQREKENLTNSSEVRLAGPPEARKIRLFIAAVCLALRVHPACSPVFPTVIAHQKLPLFLEWLQLHHPGESPFTTLH